MTASLLAAVGWGGGRQQDVRVVAGCSSSGKTPAEAPGCAERRRRRPPTAPSARENIGGLQGHAIDLQNTCKEKRFRILT